MSSLISGLPSAMVSPTVTNLSTARFTAWPTLATARRLLSEHSGRSLCDTNVEIWKTKRNELARLHRGRVSARHRTEDIQRVPRPLAHRSFTRSTGTQLPSGPDILSSTISPFASFQIGYFHACYKGEIVRRKLFFHRIKLVVKLITRKKNRLKMDNWHLLEVRGNFYVHWIFEMLRPQGIVL